MTRPSLPRLAVAAFGPGAAVLVYRRAPGLWAAEVSRPVARLCLAVDAPTRPRAAAALEDALRGVVERAKGRAA